MVFCQKPPRHHSSTSYPWISRPSLRQMYTSQFQGSPLTFIRMQTTFWSAICMFAARVADRGTVSWKLCNWHTVCEKLPRTFCSTKRRLHACVLHSRSWLCLPLTSLWYSQHKWWSQVYTNFLRMTLTHIDHGTVCDIISMTIRNQILLTICWLTFQPKF